MTAEDHEGFLFWKAQQQRFQAEGEGAEEVGPPLFSSSWCTVMALVCFVLLFVLVGGFLWWPFGGRGVVLVSTSPFASTRNGGRGKDYCTTDEEFDARSQMCMMRAHYPRAISEAIMDTRTPPCTDIYQHACGRWIAEHTNENRGFAGLRALNEVATNEIVIDEKVPVAHNLFLSCDSTLAVGSTSSRKRNWKSHAVETNAARLAILKDMLAPLADGNLRKGLPEVFARMAASDYTLPFSFVFQGHPTSQGLVPAFSYNGFDSEELDVEWVASHFALLYGDDKNNAAASRQEAKKLIDMVAKLNMARPDMSVLQSMNKWTVYVQGPDAQSDLMTWEQFKLSDAGAFDWDAFLTHLAVRAKLSSKDALKMSPLQQVWAYSHTYFHWFHPEKFGLGQWKRFIEWSVLYHTHQFFPQLPKDSLLVKEGKGAIGRRLASGDAEVFSRSQQRRKRRAPRRSGRGKRGQDQDASAITTDDCVQLTKFMLPGVVSEEYLKRNFARGEQIRARVKQVVETIKERLVANILGTPWMDERTRQLQAEKIQAIVARVVHPNEWEAEKLDLKPDQYLRNVNLIQQDRVRRNLLLWSESNNGVKCGPSCRDKITAFGTSLATVNAWYNPDRNVITIPAGILQPPFFEERYDNVSVYATIGMVVAHELSHAMDPHGSLFDKNGVLHDTWSPEARKAYRERALCIVHEYGSPEGCNNAQYGEQTLCEDTADIVGVRLAYEALELTAQTSGGGGLSKKDRQDFHVAFAQMWCASYTPDVLCDNANNDVHAIASMRVRKTLAHIPYFAQDNDCPVGSPMHRTATETCAIYYVNTTKTTKVNPV